MTHKSNPCVWLPTRPDLTYEALQKPKCIRYIYASAAQRGGQLPGCYADRVTFGMRLDRDVAAKKRLITRMKLQM
jgi:hypothetical protein